MNLTDRRPSLEPWLPWTDNVTPLATEDAVMLISHGLHREAQERGRWPRRDQQLIIMLTEGYAVCAMEHDGTLKMQPTHLAMAKRFN